MNRQIVSGAICLALSASSIVSCRHISFHQARKPSSLSNSSTALQKTASRSPAVSKPKPKSYSGRVNQGVLSQASAGANTSLVIDIGTQKGYLLVNGEIAAQCPISTARPGKYTPRGTFTMTERIRSGKISNIYNVSMPYWMRLGDSAIGVHAGYVPGYPASAGCIRLPYDMARIFYDNTRSGTKVRVYSSWPGS